MRFIPQNGNYCSKLQHEHYLQAFPLSHAVHYLYKVLSDLIMLIINRKYHPTI